MNQKEIEETWLSIKELNKELKGLKKEFYETHKTDKNGDYAFDEKFLERSIDFASEYNSKVFSLVRKVLTKELGKEYKGIYPGAGEDSEFCLLLGGKWCFLDRAYNNKIKSVNLDDFKAKAITHDFLSGKLPEGLKSESFDLSLLKYPIGIPWDVIKDTKYKLPEQGLPLYSSEWWNGLLMHCVTPLRKEGIFMSISPLEEVREKEPETRDAIDKYLKQLEKMENLLGLDTDCIHIFEYRQREDSAEPRSPGYFFYKKK